LGFVPHQQSIGRLKLGMVAYLHSHGAQFFGSFVRWFGWLVEVLGFMPMQHNSVFCPHASA
jgi:hypothetical protein